MVTQHSSLHWYFDKPTRWKHFRGLFRSATLDMTLVSPTPDRSPWRHWGQAGIKIVTVSEQDRSRSNDPWMGKRIEIEISIIELCKNRTQSRLELTLITAVNLEKFEDPRRAVNLVMKLSKYQFKTWLITLNIRQIGYLK